MIKKFMYFSHNLRLITWIFFFIIFIIISNPFLDLLWTNITIDMEARNIGVGTWLIINYSKIHDSSLNQMINYSRQLRKQIPNLPATFLPSFYLKQKPSPF